MNRTSIAFSDKARRTAEQPISYLIALAQSNPQLISFAAGLVDPMTLPCEETRVIADRILQNPQTAREALQYGSTVGYAPLREAILKHLEQLDGLPAASLSLSANDIIITTGSQQSLYIIGDVLLNPGDIVIAESPSYFVYTGALASFGARVLGMPMDRDGLVVDEVDKLLHRLQTRGELHRVKFIYCTSYYQNPTGLTLSRDRRERLVQIAKKYSTNHRILILEDAAYRELRYDGEAMPSIKSFDPDNQFVVSSYTFSKPFAPGIKSGYAVMPAELMHAVMEQKGNHDFGSSNLCQRIAYEAMRDGTYASHLQALHDGYRQKRDLMLASLQKHLGDRPDVQWTRPDGGLYIWLSLPRSLDTSRRGGMFERCLAAGVLYVPGEYCFCPDENGQIPQNHMRLCYSVTPLEQIEPGIERLARAIDLQLSVSSSTPALAASPA
ncbi:MAG: PLP-dependent aminotransferase family protein [Tepidisphaeraceae bacterium]